MPSGWACNLVAPRTIANRSVFIIASCSRYQQPPSSDNAAVVAFTSERGWLRVKAGTGSDPASPARSNPGQSKRCSDSRHRGVSQNARRERTSLLVGEQAGERRSAVPMIGSAVRLERVNAHLLRSMQIPARFRPERFNVAVVALRFPAEQLIAS